MECTYLFWVLYEYTYVQLLFITWLYYYFLWKFKKILGVIQKMTNSLGALSSLGKTFDYVHELWTLFHFASMFSFWFQLSPQNIHGNPPKFTTTKFVTIFHGNPPSS